MSIYFGSCFVPFGVLSFGLLLSNFGFSTSPLDSLQALYSFDFNSIFLVVIFMSIALGAANFCLQFGGSKLLVQTTSLLMIVEIPVATVSSAILSNKMTESSVLIGGSLIVAAAIWAIFDRVKIK